MKKEQLIKRARKWHEDSKKMPLMGYPRQHQEEMTKLSIAIIEAICESENVTPFIAKSALTMAIDIIESEMKYAPIL